MIRPRCRSWRLGVWWALIMLSVWVFSLAQPDTLKLTVVPVVPTTGHIVAVQVGRGGSAQQALRAANPATFYAITEGAPEDSVYTLGALRAGTYTFSLFRIVARAPVCTYELRGSVQFAVQPASPSGSGRIVLIVRSARREEAQALIEAENPQLRWLFDRWAELALLPGLEESYTQLLQERPGIDSIGFNSVASPPECPPPLGAAFVPGSLLVKFQEGFSQAHAEDLVRRLPPELTDFQMLPQDGSLGRESALVEIRVPVGWEKLFLHRYSRYPQVLSGWVVPARERAVYQGE